MVYMLRLLLFLLIQCTTTSSTAAAASAAAATIHTLTELDTPTEQARVLAASAAFSISNGTRIMRVLVGRRVGSMQGKRWQIQEVNNECAQRLQAA
jgi:hypothetical protein